MTRLVYLGMVLATVATLVFARPALAGGCDEECRQGVPGCGYLTCIPGDCLLCFYFCDGGLFCHFDSCEGTTCVQPE